MLTEAFMKPLAMALMRHLATAAGGAIVTHGLATASDAQTISGALVAAVGIGFSAFDKYKKTK